MARDINMKWVFDDAQLIEQRKHWRELNKEMAKALDTFERYNKMGADFGRLSQSMRQHEQEWRDVGKAAEKAAKQAADAMERNMRRAERSMSEAQRRMVEMQRSITSGGAGAGAGAGASGGGRARGGGRQEANPLEGMFGGGSFERLKNMQEMFKGGLQDLQGAMGGSLESLGALGGRLSALAGPYGIAAAAAVAAGAAFGKFANDLVNEMDPKVKMVRASFHELSSQEITLLTARIESLTKAFGGEFNENLDFIKQQMDTFGISAGKATDLFTDLNAAMGPEKAKEAMVWAKEYDTQFQKLGIGAEKMNALLINSFDMGIYDDKALDAVKEFGLKINGLSIADEKLLKDNGLFKYYEGMRKGTMSAEEGLKGITGDLEKLQKQGKDITPLAKAVFGAPGEDMGPNVARLGKMLELTEAQVEMLDNQKKKQMEVQKATEEAEQERVGFFNRIKPLVQGIQQWWEKTWQTIREGFYVVLNAVSDVLEYIWDICVGIYDAIVDVGAALIEWTVGIDEASKMWDGFIDGLNSAWLHTKAFFYAITEALLQMKILFGKTWKDIVALMSGKISFSQLLSNFAAADKAADAAIMKKYNEILKGGGTKVEDIKSKKVPPPPGVESPPGSTAGKDDAEKKKKEALDRELAMLYEKNHDEMREIKRQVREELITKEEGDMALAALTTKYAKLENDLKKKYNLITQKEQIEFNDKLKDLLVAEAEAELALIRKQGSDRLTLSQKMHSREVDEINRHANNLIANADGYSLRVIAAETERFQRLSAQNAKYREEVLANTALGRTKQTELIKQSQEEEEKAAIAHHDKMTQLTNQLTKARLDFIKDQEQKANQARIDVQKDLITEMAKLGTGGEATAAVMSSLLAFSESTSKIEEEMEAVKLQWAKLGDSTAQAYMDALKRKLAETKAVIGMQVAGQVIEGMTKIMNDIQNARLAGLDAEMAKNNKEIEQLQKKVDAEKERNEQLRERDAIQNKLAEQRIEELEQLQDTVPEAEKKRIKQSIALEKSKIKDLDKAKDKAKSAEEKRMEAIQKKNEEIEEKKRAIQQETFEMNRASQIAMAVINTAVGITKTIAEVPKADFGIATAILIALYGAMGAAQIAMIAAQPNPYKFAEGTLGVEGGIAGKDSVHALLMPGEAVIPTSTNRAYSDSINAIFNKTIPPEVLNQFVKDYHLRKFAVNGGSAVFVNNAIDTERIVTAIKSKETVNLSIDNDGLQMYVQQGLLQTKIRDKKLHRKVK